MYRVRQRHITVTNTSCQTEWTPKLHGSWVIQSNSTLRTWWGQSGQHGIKSLTGKKFSKYLPKFHSIRYFAAGRNTKQQNQLGWKCVLWSEDDVFSLSVPLLTHCISPRKSNELTNEKKRWIKKLRDEHYAAKLPILMATKQTSTFLQN